MEKKNSISPLLPLTGHLDELRRRLFWCLGAVGIAAGAGLYGAQPIIELLKHAGRVTDPLILIKPTEIVSIYVKIALSVGVTLASPLIAWQVWKFLEPAISVKLKKMIPWWIMSLFLLFAAGLAFAYYVMIPAGYGFLMNLGRSVASPMITLNNYISFTLAILLMGGVVFEMPAIAAVLAKTGILTAGMMRARRREAIFGLSVAAAVITPTTDVFNMLVCLIPMLALYEVSILVVAWMSPRQASDAEGGNNGYEED
ncbi:MAG: twin-arginine translocase subunit TatC [Endomicrobiales bacterium]|jgi:sec-independent protein translocase protein TatC